MTPSDPVELRRLAERLRGLIEQTREYTGPGDPAILITVPVAIEAASALTEAAETVERLRTEVADWQVTNDLNLRDATVKIDAPVQLKWSA